MRSDNLLVDTVAGQEVAQRLARREVMEGIGLFRNAATTAFEVALDTGEVLKLIVETVPRIEFVHVAPAFQLRQARTIAQTRSISISLSPWYEGRFTARGHKL